MMEGFLKKSLKFNNSLLNLLFQLFSIKIVSLKSFLLAQIIGTLHFQKFRCSNIFDSVIQTRYVH